MKDYDYILVSTNFPHRDFDVYQYHIFMELALLCDRRYKVESTPFKRRLYTKRYKRALTELLDKGILKEDEQYLEISDDYKGYIKFAPEELANIS